MTEILTADFYEIHDVIGDLIEKNGRLRQLCIESATLLKEPVELDLEPAPWPLSDIAAGSYTGVICILWNEGNRLHQQYIEIQRRLMRQDAQVQTVKVEADTENE
jgi:hypothetical protein